MTRVDEEIKLENVRLIYRNFAGEERQFNVAGQRNFAIPLDEDLANHLSAIGWNVKKKERVIDGEIETLYHLPVKVKMDGRVPPKIFTITKSKNRRNQLDEETVGMLDWAEYETVDVILRPFNWDVNGKQGVTAYLKTLFMVLHEDELELKYSHIPEDGDPLALEDGSVIDLDPDQYWESSNEIPGGNEPRAITA
jgi:hypothetical protein